MSPTHPGIIGSLSPGVSTRLYCLDEVAAILRLAERSIGLIPGLYDVARPTKRGGFAWTWRDIMRFARGHEMIRPGGRVPEGTHFLTAKETAAYIGVSASAVVGWHLSFDGPRVFVFSRKRFRYAVTDVDAWLSTQTALEDVESQEERISKLVAARKAPTSRVLNRRFLSASVGAGRDLGKPGGPAIRGDRPKFDSAEIGDGLDFAD